MRDARYESALELISSLQKDRFFLEFMPLNVANDLLAFVKEYMENSIPMEFLERWFGDNYDALTDLQMEWRKQNE